MVWPPLKIVNMVYVFDTFPKLGELPIKARIHIGTLTLFHSIWSNPETTIFRILQYILSKSCTWSAHVRHLCLRYALPDPLELLSCSAWPKSKWLEIVKTKVTMLCSAPVESTQHVQEIYGKG